MLILLMEGLNPKAPAVTHDPFRVQRKLEQALSDFESGRLNAAERKTRKVLGTNPGDASALNLLAAIANSKSCHAEAREFLLQALVSQPNNPFILANLGEMCRKLGLLNDATFHLRKALTLKPDLAGAQIQLGEVAILSADWNGAELSFQNALATYPGMPAAHYGLGRTYFATREYSKAVDHFELALKYNSSSRGTFAAAIFANLGTARLASGKFEPGLHALCDAIECDRANDDAWRILAKNLVATAVIPSHSRFRDIVLSLLTRPDINPRTIATAAVLLLRQDERWQALLGGTDLLSPTDLQGPHCGTRAELTSDPLFLILLSQAPIPDMGLERFLTAWRRYLLLTPGALIEPGLDAVSALATQCFLNEYIYPTSDDEECALERLLAKLASGPSIVGEEFWPAAALVASYVMLHNTPLADWASEAPATLAPLFRQQVVELRVELNLRESIARLRPIHDDLSHAVQRQYEENPYPRWLRCAAETPRRFPDAVRSALPHLRNEPLPDPDKPSILIAGCGTGIQTMRAVGNYRNADILAVDLSATSLAYGMRKLEEIGIEGVRHLQADILDLDLLDEKFDLIECFGVLHHMANAQLGLNILARHLKPGGVMLLGLYSTIARQSVIEARALIAAEGYASDPNGIRAARADIGKRRADPAFAALVSPASDFWTMSEVRDLLFNVQELRFTLLEIERMLSLAGLEFLGMQPLTQHDAMRFAAMHTKPEAQRSLSAWHAFEQKYPHSFGETYRFWVRNAG